MAVHNLPGATPVNSWYGAVNDLDLVLRLYVLGFADPYDKV